MKRTPLVIGNWKMHNTCAATRSWCAGLAEDLAERPLAGGVELGVAPPATALGALHDAARDLPLIIAAQNCHADPFGAYTGEIAIDMLREHGCSMVILGHSERRHLYGETDASVGRKVAAVTSAGLTPVLCVGETQNQRASRRTEAIIEGQLRHGLNDVTLEDGARLVVAYEPVWAIGTGEVATAEQAQQAQAFLRGILEAIADAETAASVRILYGGSVKPENARALASQPDVDGFLVGGASLDAGGFRRIADAFS